MERFTEDHEWVRLVGDIATVGITDFAQQKLGELVYVELPEPKREVKKGDIAAVVESVKAASEIYTPVSGEVIEVNQALSNEPGLINSDPTASGWLFKVKTSDPSEFERLLSFDDYKALTT
ncbi:MAG: glycine cleavage system protein GcvH [Xanthobacteraceae bacterium]|jgi:glycine cleavage system H protein